MSKKIIVAITGASGMIYAKRFLEKLQTEALKEHWSEVAIVLSDNAKGIWNDEDPGGTIEDFGFPVYSNSNYDVPFASGSSVYNVMVVVPCSMGSLGRIATGVSENLIGRAADVMLKERKKLILVTREMPLNLIHINNMKTVTEAGAIVCPASPTFYHHPQSILELVDTVIDRVLDLSGFEHFGKRWKVE
jgi:4-hydroxy-3-polyprenylbenzoate decarboxylase